MENGSDPGPLRWLALGVGLLAASAFLVSVEPVWHPVTLFAALAFVVHPWMGERKVSRVVHALAGLTVIWLLWRIRDLLAPLFVALLLAYVLSPVFRWLRGESGRWRPFRFGRTLASAVLTLAMLGLILLVGAQTGSLLVQQANEFARVVESASSNIDSIFPAEWSESEILSSLSEGIITAVREIAGRLPELASAVTSGFGYALAGILGILTTLIFTFYALRDSGELSGAIRQRYLPDSIRGFVDSRSGRVLRTLRLFIHGYFLTSMIVFLLTLVLLLAAGVRMAFLLALVAGLLNIIPVIGFWVSTALILVLALASGMGLTKVLLLWLGLALINVFEGNFLTPRIVGRRVGLHPVVAIMSVAIFGRILGFVGVLLGIPLAAVLTAEWEEFLESRRHRREDPQTD